MRKKKNQHLLMLLYEHSNICMIIQIKEYYNNCQSQDDIPLNTRC